jgi:hypothetical protein
VIDYKIVVLGPEQFTSMVQILMCCWNVGLQWRAPFAKKNGGLTQLLALEQFGGSPVLCSRKISIGR